MFGMTKPKAKTKAKTKAKPKAQPRSTGNYQVATKGKLSRAKDRKIKAKPPGYRKSASGNWYSERRINRSDKSRRAKL